MAGPTDENVRVRSLTHGLFRRILGRIDRRTAQNPSRDTKG